jgi:hypothetical protein
MNSGNACHYSVPRFNTPSTLQNAEDQDIRNNFFSFTYGCENCIPTFRKEHKLQVLGNKFWKISEPTTDKVNEQFRVVHNEKLCDLYTSASNVGTWVAQSV